MVEARENVRGAGNGRDAVLGEHASHGERCLVVRRPVVDAGQQVTVKVDHAQRALVVGMQLSGVAMGVCSLANWKKIGRRLS